MRIGISGASGTLGGLAVDAALARIAATDLVVTTRTPDRLAYLAARGVTVRHADFDVPESLAEAFAGINRLLIVSTTNETGKRFEQHAAAINAARAAGVEYVVFTSMPNTDDPNHATGLAAEEYHAAEKLLAASGVPFTVLRNAPYAELHVIERMLPALAMGQLRINTGDGTAAFMTRSDIADAAIAVLLGEVHAARIVDLTGGELLTYRQIVQLVAAVTGARIDYVELDDATFEQEATAVGMPASLVDTLTRIGIAIRGGSFAVRTGFFREVTGREPQSMAAVLEANRDILMRALES